MLRLEREASAQGWMRSSQKTEIKRLFPEKRIFHGKLRQLHTKEISLIHYQNVPAAEQAKIDAKLEELRQNTGRVWTCEITRKPESTDPARFLEIALDNQVLKPVELNEGDASSGEAICRELERAYQEHTNT